MLSNGQALWAHCSTQLFVVERKHPFAHAHLADEDLSIDFARNTTPQDKVAVVVTAPLTTNEDWTAHARRANCGCSSTAQRRARGVRPGLTQPRRRRAHMEPGVKPGLAAPLPARRRTSPARRSRSAA